MNTAVRLNHVILENSPSSQLVLLTLPRPPKNRSTFQHSYMVRSSFSRTISLSEKKNPQLQVYLDVLTENLQRVLFIGGSGKEVITIDS
ncbi:hypothetical protein Aduo_003869 [Ancylostoma duodenale]